MPKKRGEDASCDTIIDKIYNGGNVAQTQYWPYRTPMVGNVGSNQEWHCKNGHNSRSKMGTLVTFQRLCTNLSAYPSVRRQIKYEEKWPSAHSSMSSRQQGLTFTICILPYASLDFPSISGGTCIVITITTTKKERWRTRLTWYTIAIVEEAEPLFSGRKSLKSRLVYAPSVSPYEYSTTVEAKFESSS